MLTSSSSTLRLSSTVPLLHSSNLLRKNDVLGSNILFGVLAITLVEQFIIATTHRSYVETPTQPAASILTALTINAAIWLPVALGMILIGGCYYAIRKGKLWAKVLVLFLWCTYSSTSLPDGVVAGIIFSQLFSWPLITLTKAVFNIAALVLMFTKSREAVPSST
jgi:hypothetical protein